MTTISFRPDINGPELHRFHGVVAGKPRAIIGRSRGELAAWIRGVRTRSKMRSTETIIESWGGLGIGDGGGGCALPVKDD